MPKKRSTTYKHLIACFYVSIRNNEDVDTNWVKGNYGDKDVSFTDIATDRFMSTGQNRASGVKMTTVERYLREFRAIDCNRRANDKPLATVKELAPF